MSQSVATDTSYSVKIKKKKGDKIGVTLFKSEDGSISVSNIRPNTPAAKTNLKLGDKILTINGKNAEEFSSKEAAEFLQKSKGEVEIVLDDAGAEPDPSVVTTPEEIVDDEPVQNKDAKDYFTAASSVVILKDIASVKEQLFNVEKIPSWSNLYESASLLSEGTSGPNSIGTIVELKTYSGTVTNEEIIKATSQEVRLLVQPESLHGPFEYIEKIFEVKSAMVGVSKVTVTYKYRVKFGVLGASVMGGMVQKEMGDGAFGCAYGLKHYVETEEEVTADTKLYEPITFGTLTE